MKPLIVVRREDDNQKYTWTSLLVHHLEDCLLTASCLFCDMYSALLVVTRLKTSDCFNHKWIAHEYRILLQ